MEKKIEKILKEYRDGTTPLEEAMEKMRLFVYESLGFATIDHHRKLRQGFPEVVYGEGKDISTIMAIVEKMVEKGTGVMVTRVTGDKGRALEVKIGGATYHDSASILTVGIGIEVNPSSKPVVIVSAGTSDMAVAEEAAVTAEFFGNEVSRLYDVGVAGIHRLLYNREIVDSAAIVIVVAGMEGALPSVVGGVSGKPVIAVPTSVGYGASFGGISALLGMLNACSPGVVVTNIDNGFGAAYFASLIQRGGQAG
jgi:NCAIR mutase (PurE)-related protein